MIKKITYNETMELRQKILRPHMHKNECIYIGDRALETAHFAAFSKNNEIVGVASVYRQTESGKTAENDWRFRGFATLEEVRGRGFGKELLQKSIHYVKRMQGKRIWCSARLSAIPFYEKFGFKKIGEEFDLPNIGLHYVIELLL
jgi:predicted GNAT family N-acyltransferase